MTYYILFYAKLFQNTQRKHFSWDLFLTEVRSSGLQACKISEQEDFCKNFLGIFEISENSFLSELFKINICRGVFRSAVGCRLHSCNRLKSNSTTYIFLDIFKSFWCSYSTYPQKICSPN